MDECLQTGALYAIHIAYSKKYQSLVTFPNIDGFNIVNNDESWTKEGISVYAVTRVSAALVQRDFDAVWIPILASKQVSLDVLPDIVRTTSIHSEQTKEGFITLERQSLPLFLRKDAVLYAYEFQLTGGNLAGINYDYGVHSSIHLLCASDGIFHLDWRPSRVSSTIYIPAANLSHSHSPGPEVSFDQRVICAAPFIGSCMRYLDAVSDDANSYKYDPI
ncbi:uncharacterized protein BT62DRAFT_1012470 [Guyanagaster necrorhizus]|uniref:Uncharacterized protein n=1 Tax=Guyanagaster necrorhizus TaxID=856835 RepID=A0A9P7VIK3_9AGAR|nr:uncharacterized protein BT62DRAFT_1012470 [Guyanagaster necrorhizus MCA 3950]KAG7440696.1 hypothetical protein BT62DRAFT_1012470 [Guyanagaster necrorhizus MCA 3950]